ncbi:hypothetical protein D3C81_1284750 [compost metagenome]
MVHEAQHELGFGIALIRSLAIPIEGLAETLWQSTFAFVVQVTHEALHLRIALLGTVVSSGIRSRCSPAKLAENGHPINGLRRIAIAEPALHEVHTQHVGQRVGWPITLALG